MLATFGRGFDFRPLHCPDITARSSNASAVLEIVILSVRLSVCSFDCHTRALWRNKITYCRYIDSAWKGNHSNFWIPTKVGGRCPLPPAICAQSDSLPFEKRQLRPILLVTWVTLSANFRWKGHRPPTSVNIRKLEQLPFHVVLKYWQYIISFCHKTRVCVTERQMELRSPIPR